MIESRTTAQPYYCGAFFDEEGSTKVVPGDTTARQIISYFPDRDEHLGRWFGIEVVEQNWQRWTTSEGEYTWKPYHDGNRKSWWIYIGELLTAEDIRALPKERPDEYDILLRNMEGNDWPLVVRTSCGNYKPFGADDAVFAASEVTHAVS